MSGSRDSEGVHGSIIAFDLESTRLLDMGLTLVLMFFLVA